jgi:DNA-directed RNA polymerase specialized sigma24 family protein
LPVTLHCTAADHASPVRPGGDPTTGSVLAVEAKGADDLHEAFWDTHAARLHGFALLLTIGDEPRATSAAVAALQAGAGRADELRHPERAAGWLRHQVITELRRSWPTPRLTAAERRDALRKMRVAETVISSLEAMSVERRAALVAGVIEGLDAADVATALDTDLASASRTVEGARREYLAAATPVARASGPTPGPLAQRIQEMTAHAGGSMPAQEPA